MILFHHLKQFLFLALLVVPSLLACNFPSSELTALHELYSAANGPYWTWLTPSLEYGIPWDFTTVNPNPCDDDWQGIDCDLIKCSVIVLTLNKNNMTGSIPNSIGQLTEMVNLTITNNPGLTGTIPSTVIQMTNLNNIDLDTNALTGTIPSGLSTLTGLTQINLYVNALNGTIPDELGTMTQLILLDVSENQMTGTLPPSLGNLVNLQQIFFFENYFHGTIPSSYGNFNKIIFMGMNDNAFTGSIPPTFGNLTALQALYLNDNHLTGSLPASLGNLKYCHDLYMYNNHFTGTLPSELSQMSSLANIYIYNNFLSGTFPEEWTQLTKLSVIYINQNRISGTIPASYGYSWSLLTRMFFNENLLTGTIPPSLGNLNNMYFFYLDFNQLTGTLPPQLGNITALRTIYVNSNYLEGSLPTTLKKCKLMAIFYLASNHFTGQVNTYFNNFHYLQDMILYQNDFTGPVDTLVNITYQKLLYTIDISYNQFTGSLSGNIFKNSAYRSFAATQNCLQGSLPEEICTSHGLEIILLDGLHTNTGCTRPYFPGLSSTYPLSDALQGSIPPCIFNMTNLKTLHLAGNGIKGSLSNDLVLSPKLINLTLAHNQLTGDIPSVIQNNVWNDLDLSFNKFRGKLSSHLIASHVAKDNLTSLSLQVNRISGLIPSQLDGLKHINILRGNMFTCNSNKNNLPTHDSEASTYNCGSDNVNQAIYVWIAIVGTAAMLFLIFYIGVHYDVFYSQESFRVVWQEFSSWFSIYSDAVTVYSNHSEEMIQAAIISDNSSTQSQLNPDYNSIIIFNRLIYGVIRYCLRVLLAALLICIPVYSALSASFGTYDEQYAWSISMGFISGVTPAVVLLIIFFILAYRFILHPGIINSYESLALKLQASSFTFLSTCGQTLFVCCQTSSWDRQYILNLIIILSLLFLNAAIGLAANIVFVYYSTGAYVLLTTLLLSAFKYGWSQIIVLTYLHKYMKHLQLFSIHIRSLILLYLNLFNNVISPLIASALVSSNCFYYIISKSPTIASENSICFSTIIGGSQSPASYCQLAGSTSSQFSAPFMYEHECSSALLTSFSDVFIYRYTLSGVVVPLLMTLIIFYQEYYNTNILLSSQPSSRITSVSDLPPAASQRNDSTASDQMNNPVRSSIISRASSLIRTSLISNQSNERSTSQESEMPEIRKQSGSVSPPPSANASFSNQGAFNPIASSSLTSGPSTVSPISSSPRPSKISQSSADPVNISSIPINQDIEASQHSTPSVGSNSRSSISIVPMFSFDKERFLIVLLNDISLLLTFGILFPPIAVIVSISIIFNLNLLRWRIGRMMQLSKLSSEYLLKVKELNRECEGILELIVELFPQIGFSVTIIWSFFLFDILGDEYGITGSLWILIITAFMPFYLGIIDRLLVGYLVSSFLPSSWAKPKKEEENQESNLENNTKFDQINPLTETNSNA